MAAVISNRVKAGLKDRLPPGAVEAEFAILKARMIREGVEADLHEHCFGAKLDDSIIMPGVERRSRKLKMLRPTRSLDEA